MKKKVVSGKELFDKMSSSINLLCDTVKSTLGPSGNNVIINESTMSPFITNDGVSIAENIESEDEVENTILTIAKEASIKTNELVGDGTTTTLVLFQSIFNDGLELISNGYNPIKLKKEIDESINIIIDELNKFKRECSSEDLKQIACVSSNDNYIGELIYEVYSKSNLVKINESINDKTTYKIVNGYRIDSTSVSDYFFNNKKEINLKDTYILLTLDRIESVYELNNIISEIDSNKSLLIIAEDFSDEVINEMVMQSYQGTLNVCLVKSPGYGSEKYDILRDISVISNAKICGCNYGVSTSDIKLNDLGRCKEVKINNEETIIIDALGSENDINNLKNSLKEEISSCSSDYEKELLSSRLAYLDNGIGIIYVGASTNTERKEKKMRYEDALCAIKSCSEGVLVGEGISLLKIKSILEGKISSIVLSSLEKPFLQIIDNNGLDKEEIFNVIKKSNYEKIYNVLNNQYENITTSKIIDPYLVVKSEIINACSIASMLLTTKYLVINEKENNNLIKNDNFNI